MGMLNISAKNAKKQNQKNVEIIEKNRASKPKVLPKIWIRKWVLPIVLMEKCRGRTMIKR